MIKPLTLTARLLALLLCAVPAFAESPVVHTDVIFTLDKEVVFEVSRGAVGAELVLRIDRPIGEVSQDYLDPADPLITGVSLAPDGNGTVARVFLREHSVRATAQTLNHPFRIVLDLFRDVQEVRAERSIKAAQQSSFVFNEAIRQRRAPLALIPVLPERVKGQGEALFEAAVMAFSRNQTVKAESLLQRFLVQYPNSQLMGPTAYLLAELHYREAWTQGDAARAKAAKQFNQLVQEYPRSPNLPLALVRMAEVLVAEAKWVEAKPLLTVVLEDYLDSPFLRAASLLRGQVALGENHVRTALAQFRAVQAGGKLDKPGIAASLGEAETLVRMGRFPEAVKLYAYGVSHDRAGTKGDPHQLRLMGRALMDAGHYRDARRVFLLLYNIYPSHYSAGLALSQVADTFRGEGLWELAELRYLDVINGYPKGEGSLAARMALADLYVDRHHENRVAPKSRVPGDPLASIVPNALLTEALRLYNEMIEIAPSDALSEEALYKVALLYQEMNDNPSSLAQIRLLLKRNPRTHWRIPARELAEDVLAGYATELVAAGRPEAAIAVFREDQDVLFSPGLRGWRPHYPLGLAHEALGLNREAMRHFLSLLGSRAPDHFRSRSLYRLGNLFLLQNEPDQALDRLTYYLRRFPNGDNVAQVRLAIARSYVALEDDEAALNAYQRYMKYHADDPALRQARLAAAQVATRLGRVDQARKWYRAVLREDEVAGAEGVTPSSPAVQLLLADLEFTERRYPAALSEYAKALEMGLDGENLRWVQLRVGLAQLALSRQDDAQRSLTELASVNDGELMRQVASELVTGLTPALD